ncbi:hypothetical protein [Streptomyces huiliensis]|uniref:hypothetical protein n=1 Tax=Streptomyces huiliensis TaxID=2876027 RepID=UPI001CC0C711|nr:hypothetical protein [Streptomyces huiliensis]MBZ4322719.1 hypothetical protein [Streptomyces huiliensis]
MQSAHLTAAAPRRFALTAGAVLAALALTACGSSDKGKSDSAKAGAEKSGSTSSGTGASGTKSGDKTDAGARELAAGQPSPEEQELEADKKKGKFVVTGQKVVMGKPESLKGGSDAKKFVGKTVAFAYLKAKLADGDAPMKPPMMTTDIGTLVEGNAPGTPLLTIGTLPGTPDDCRDEDYVKPWRKGEERVVCRPFVVPEGKKVTHITYRRGFYKEPLRWALAK